MCFWAKETTRLEDQQRLITENLIGGLDCLRFGVQHGARGKLLYLLSFVITSVVTSTHARLSPDSMVAVVHLWSDFAHFLPGCLRLPTGSRNASSGMRSMQRAEPGQSASCFLHLSPM